MKRVIGIGLLALSLGFVPVLAHSPPGLENVWTFPQNCCGDGDCKEILGSGRDGTGLWFRTIDGTAYADVDTEWNPTPPDGKSYACITNNSSKPNGKKLWCVFMRAGS